MKKKTVSIITLILLATCLLAMPVQAAVSATVAPCFEDIHLLYANIDINDSGLATAYTYVSTATDSYTVYLTVYLQRLSGDTWYTVTYGSTSGSGVVDKSVSRYVSHGYYYRAKGVVTICTSSGSFVESATINSNSQYY